ncbi:hypothetical protein HK405_007303 [Cladochytrium tenue]|nr:hypothetical protein HK405_007303 [Cladochytrium tenue]
MAQQVEYKMEYPAQVYLPQAALTNPVDLQSVRRTRRAAALLGVSAVLAFFTVFVPDRFWTFHVATDDYSVYQYVASVYYVVCYTESKYSIAYCHRFDSDCYLNFDTYGSDPTCGLEYSRLAFALAVLLVGFTACVMAARRVAAMQPGRKNAFAATVVYLALLVVLMALTAANLGLFIKDTYAAKFTCVVFVDPLIDDDWCRKSAWPLGDNQAALAVAKILDAGDSDRLVSVDFPRLRIREAPAFDAWADRDTLRTALLRLHRLERLDATAFKIVYDSRQEIRFQPAEFLARVFPHLEDLSSFSRSSCSSSKLRYFRCQHDR